MNKNDPHPTQNIWQNSLINNLDSGLVVLDKKLRVRHWNHFMANHSGISADQTLGQSLFTLFPHLDHVGFKSLIERVFQFKSAAYLSWEEQPYLFRFSSHRPISGSARFMYQNTTLLPLSQPGQSEQMIALCIYDVTEQAMTQQALLQAREKIKQLERTDPVSGLTTQNYWESFLNHEYERYRRTRQPASLMLIDVDQLKELHEQYGLAAYNAIIQQVATSIRQTIRNTDIAARYDTGAFAALLLPDTPGSNAETLAQRLQFKVQTTEWIHQGEKHSITLSMGLAAADYEYNNHNTWVAHADEALHQAKAKGNYFQSYLTH